MGHAGCTGELRVMAYAVNRNDCEAINQLRRCTISPSSNSICARSIRYWSAWVNGGSSVVFMRHRARPVPAYNLLQPNDAFAICHAERCDFAAPLPAIQEIKQSDESL